MKSTFTYIGISLFIQLMAVSLMAQKKVVILGSSTAAGYGATPGNGWVDLLQASFRKNTGDGIDTVILNQAMPGYITYKGLPTGWVMPANRQDPNWAPDPNRNVTWVLAQNPRPDIVVLSYPSNDANLPDYQKKETMDNFRTMYNSFVTAGIRTFVTTTQPRNDMSDAQRQMLREVRDSVVNTFALYSIVFWDDLVTTDGTNRLKDEVNADGVHPNNLGHSYLFQRVQSKDMFSTVVGAPLPLTLKDWQVTQDQNKVVIKWTTAHEEPSTFFEIQRSADGRDYQPLVQKAGNGSGTPYQWTDQSPLQGKSYYRLKITEPGKTSYSAALHVMHLQKQQLISAVYTDGGTLHIKLSQLKDTRAVLDIINYSGALVKKLNVDLARTTQISVPISELPSGQYFLKLMETGVPGQVYRFYKLK